VSDEDSCPFCRIARGEAPAEIICEASEWVAFFPRTPAVPGHTLVIPRQHVHDFLDLGPALGSSMMQGIIRVSRAVRTALQPDGMNLISSSGKAADQTVFHLHFYVVPRRTGDRVGHIWPPRRPMNEELKEDLADLIRAACGVPDDAGHQG
jgi:histidine triad (HIT) family protein